MDHQWHQRVREVFDAALEVEARAREAFLVGHPEADPKVLAEVRELLQVHDTQDTFLPTGGVRAFETESALVPKDWVGRMVGPYRIQAPLARGGMGLVFLAQQENPARLVALKMLPGALPNAEILRRFGQEADWLGRLQHQNVAQVFQAGTVTWEDGMPRPYLAMEYVDGADIWSHIQSEGLSITARLELLAQVCDGVHHAHQKGVLHRDLKPGNVLVNTLGVPKILDFGIARELGSDPKETLQTRSGELLGTVPYMSPEQVAGKSATLDTRTDVYSLGALLYQCLGGELPYPSERYTLPEMLVAIAESRPPLLGQLDPALRGDVELIVSKAMDKDVDRRYDSAAGLAADIRRYLALEPILARPATTRYQLRQFAKRNRGLVASLGGAVLALLLGFGGTAWGLAKARTANAGERVEAEKAKAAAEAAQVSYQAELLQRKEAEEAKELAEAKERKALAVREFMEDLLKSPGQRDLQNLMGAHTRVIDMLEGSDEAIRRRFAGEPETAQALFALVGQTYVRLGTAKKGIQYLQDALQLSNELYGEDSSESLRLRWSLTKAQGLSDLTVDGVARAQAFQAEFKAAFGEGSEEYFKARLEVAREMSLRGQFEEAIGGYQALLDEVDVNPALRPEHEFSIRQGLAVAQSYIGAPEKAEDQYAQIHLLIEKEFGPDSFESATNMMNYGMHLLVVGKLKPAEACLQSAVEYFEKRALDESLMMAQCRAALGQAYSMQGKPEKALELAKEAHRVMQKILEPGDIRVSDSALGHGLALAGTGRVEEAYQVFDEVEEGLVASVGPGHRLVCEVRARKSFLELQRGNPQRGVEILTEQFERVMDDPDRDLTTEVFIREQLARVLGAIPDYETAVPHYRAIHRAKAELLGKEAEATLLALYQVGRVLEALGRNEEVVQILEGSYREYQGEGLDGGSRTIAGYLVEHFGRQGDSEQAQTWSAKSAAH